MGPLDHPKLATGMWDDLELNIVIIRARLQVSNYSVFVLGVASSLTPEGEGGRQRSVVVPFTLAVARLISNDKYRAELCRTS
jgi:hypothetical protein